MLPQGLNPNRLLRSGPETADCSGEDGAEGAVPLHPAAHVLGSVRPAGNQKSGFQPGRKQVALQSLKAAASPPQGSRWTLQATTMDGDFVRACALALLWHWATGNPVLQLDSVFLSQQGLIIIQPDQMQVRHLLLFRPLLVYVFILWTGSDSLLPPDCQPHPDPYFGAHHGQSGLPAHSQVQI